MLDVRNVSKYFQSGDSQLTVLNQVTFSLATGSSCAIIGPSGSGKTTLLGLCAGLDRPSNGTISINGAELTSLDEDGRAALRSQTVGFIFQNFQLLPTLTAVENVMVPAELRGETGVLSRAKELLDRVGLGARFRHYPAQLSGGEQQRVALARAFINQPKILFADEPTGNLDTENSEKVISLLFDLNRSAGTTLVLVTHNLELAGMCQRRIRIHSGIISEETYS
ncbi:MAG: ABC transporter ATP-binding protein [Verrucomicrobiota bacterium]|nr:ABC transporter ATP-binding protein [Verrucomicrobiota bacterium]